MVMIGTERGKNGALVYNPKPNAGGHIVTDITCQERPEGSSLHSLYASWSCYHCCLPTSSVNYHRISEILGAMRSTNCEHLSSSIAKGLHHSTSGDLVPFSRKKCVNSCLNRTQFTTAGRPHSLTNVKPKVVEPAIALTALPILVGQWLEPQADAARTITRALGWVGSNAVFTIVCVVSNRYAPAISSLPHKFHWWGRP